MKPPDERVALGDAVEHGLPDAELRGEDLPGRERNIDRSQRRRRASERRRHAEQSARERELRDDQPSAEPADAQARDRRRLVLHQRTDAGSRRPKRGHKAGGDGRRQPDERGERHDRRIDAEIHPERIEHARRGRREELQAGVRQQQACDTGNGREHDGLHESLAHQPRPAGAERHLDRRLSRTCGRTGQQQVGDVRARHKQDERDERDEQFQSPSNVRGRLHLRERKHLRPPVVVNLRIAGSQTPDRRLQFATRRVGGHAPAQPAEYPQIVTRTGAARRARIERQPDARIDGESETRRHDADHRPRPAIEPDRPSDDGVIAAEAPPPERIADDSDIGRTRLKIGGGEHPAAGRANLKQREGVGGDERRLEPFRLGAVAADVDRGGLERAERLEARQGLRPGPDRRTGWKAGRASRYQARVRQRPPVRRDRAAAGCGCPHARSRTSWW